MLPHIDTKRKKRVVLGMSGGVDSSVAAALLLEKGYDVIGVTMKIMPCELEDEREKACCSLSAIEDARKVARDLGIPHYVLNFEELFSQKVIDYFTKEYLQGRTPNPCIACNRYLKFGELLNKARSLDAQFVATGHYARIGYDEQNKRFLLLKGKDTGKDQSYVLYNLKQEQLQHILFPLGDFTKEMIRKKAGELGLVVASKAESQEICFIPDNDYKEFLQRRVGKEKIKPGYFLNTKGEIIGRHQGLANYTVGQRKGLGLALGYPAYVVSLDTENNTVIIGREEEIYSSGLWAKDNNFIAIENLNEPLEVEAKIRYSAPPAAAVIQMADDRRVRVDFVKPQRAVTPGQAVVYYQGDVVIGGGIIDEVNSFHSER